MKKALIDPNVIVYELVAWNPPETQGGPYTPVYQEIPNSDRLAEVVDAEFQVAPPLFWVDCSDAAVADQWYYNNATNECLVIPPGPPYPSTGSQTL
jgi:hypothetical protein